LILTSMLIKSLKITILMDKILLVDKVLKYNIVDSKVNIKPL